MSKIIAQVLLTTLVGLFVASIVAIFQSAPFDGR